MVRAIDLSDCVLEEGPGRDGFWFRATELGVKLAAERIGAGLYEARAGVPIWPYHYHYPDEEWLYVLDGAPVLRGPTGRRPLTAGDLTCFPAGHRGAHTVEGPGRFIIFSAAQSSGPFVSVYPDSDKVSVSPGIEPGDINAMLLGRSGAVDYWHGEGDGAVPPAPVTREPDDVPETVTLNAFTLDGEPADGQVAALGERLGADRLDAAVLTLAPGTDSGPYHYEYGRERWLLGLTGTVTIASADGQRPLSAGQVACLPEGPAGGRRLLNASGESIRLLLLWTTGVPSAVCYPDTGEWALRPTRGEAEIHLRAG